MPTPIIISHHRRKNGDKIKQEIRKRDPTTQQRVYIDDLYFKSHYQYAQVRQWVEDRHSKHKRPYTWVSLYILMLESYTHTKWTMENNSRLKEVVREIYPTTTDAFLNFIMYLEKEGL